jgi:hypothetical protein
MSIFDILRYSGTNLGSLNELKALPEELIQLYWNVIMDSSGYRRERHEFIAHKEKCAVLVSWYHYKKRTDFSAAFIQALREYNIEDNQ